MTDTEKRKILKMADRAVDEFFKYRRLCAEIEVLLDKHYDGEIVDVLYQMSDGLVVETPYSSDWGDFDADNNIPIEQFVEEL